MRWRLRPKPKRVPGEYPERFVKSWMATTLPTATPAEAASAVDHLRSKGWTEEQVAEFILPYMPREAGTPAIRGGDGAPIRGARGAGTMAWAADESSVAPPRAEQPPAAPPADPPVALPPDVTRSWLDEHLRQMDRRQLRFVVDELERRGWPSGAVAMAVLPHLLPTLPIADRRAVIAGLSKLGMNGVEIARATRPP
ncbi:MAG: hypothetical protein Q8O67_11400 [Deltaproteobacteria bacterium]|nr:hypothetical protein [Deltaproteobacteria bacterium]